MKLTFLGTGTSTGVPTIGCSCNVCKSDDPRDHRLRSSALLSVGGKNLLIDCGPDFRQQILSVGSPELRALLITHYHYDHVGGIDDLRPYCGENGFDVYCREDVDRNLRMIVPYCYIEHPDPGAPTFNNHIISQMQPFDIDGIEILPLPVKHFQLDILGFRIGNLAYMTDAKVIPDETIEAVRGVDTLVINALRHKEHFSHMSLSDALAAIGAIKPRVAYLIHMSHDYGHHAEVDPQLPEGVHTAYDGLTIEIPN